MVCIIIIMYRLYCTLVYGSVYTLINPVESVESKLNVG